ncbi:MAG: hypothetical protein H0V09_09190 [Gemmatimonadetes bacterium]|nr:hypothetical protein [Gemmatimonadota bacterium]
MSLVPRPATLGLALVLLSAVSLHAQGYRYRAQPGDSASYRLTSTARIHQEFQGDSTNVTVRSEAVLNVVDVQAEPETLSYGVTFDSLSIRFDDAAMPSPDVTPILGRIMTLSVSPTGRLRALEIPPDIPAALTGCDLRQMLSNFLPRFPEVAGAEASWSDTLSFGCLQQGIEAQVRVVTTYAPRASQAEGEGGPEGEVQLAYSTETTLSGKGEQNGTPLLLDGHGRGAGTIRMGPRGEVFLGSIGRQTLELEVEAAPPGSPPIRIPVRQEITSEVRRR